MKFKEIKTREEFVKTLPIMKQDLGDVNNDDEMADNFMVARDNNYQQFAALDGETVIAVIGMTKVFNPNYPGPAYDITNLVVDENNRRKGIGSEILTFCKKYVSEKGGSCLRLCAYPSNYKALAFYQKNDFKHTANFMFHDLEGQQQ